MITLNDQQRREDEVWKLPNNGGLIVSSDGKVYAYLKSLSYVNIAEINAVGLNEDAQSTIKRVRDAGHEFWIDPTSISLDYVCWYYIEDRDEFYFN